MGVLQLPGKLILAMSQQIFASLQSVGVLGQGKAAVCVGVVATAGGEAAVWQEKIGNVAGVLDLVACTKAVVGVEATGVGAVATAPSMLSAAGFKAGGVKAGSIAAFGKTILAMLQLDPSLHLCRVLEFLIQLQVSRLRLELQKNFPLQPQHVGSLNVFSRKSNSRITNVRLSVHLSVLQNIT